MELNLYTLYFLFLKLPKILCKGKLFSFMLYLMKPNILLLLIKGGRRVQRQMMRSRLFASLREIICPPPQQHSFSRLSRQWNQSFLLFSIFFSFFFPVPVQRPKLTPKRRKYGATAEKNKQENSIIAPMERLGYHLKAKEMNV